MIIKEEQENLSRTEVEQVQQKEIEYQFINKFRKRKGLRLYSCDPKTLIVKEVKLDKRKVAKIEIHDNTFKKSADADNVLNIDPNLIYFQALNLKSAINRVFKALSTKKKLFNLQVAR